MLSSFKHLQAETGRTWTNRGLTFWGTGELKLAAWKQEPEWRKCSIARSQLLMQFLSQRWTDCVCDWIGDWVIKGILNKLNTLNKLNKLNTLNTLNKLNISTLNTLNNSQNVVWKGFSMPPSPRQWYRAHTHTLAANISQHLFRATISMNFATLRTLRPSNACIDVCAFCAQCKQFRWHYADFIYSRDDFILPFAWPL